MKFIIIVLSLLITLSCLLITNAQICPNLKGAKEKDPSKPIGDPSKEDDPVFPQDFQKAKAKENALNQTTAARKLFYTPSTKVTDQLKAAATKLLELFTKNKSFTYSISLIERQTGGTGSLSGEFNQYAATLYSEWSDKDQKFWIDEITKISEGKGNSKDLLGFIALIGDMGAIIQDHYHREDKTDHSQNIVNSIASAREDLKLETISSQVYRWSPDTYYLLDTKGNAKKEERQTCDVKIKRAGLFNLGGEADKAIGQKDNLLPEIGWPLQTVPLKLINKCPDEPWAGHFSGSLYELIMMLDFLTGQNSMKVGQLGECHAAIAAGFLLATGMHSASEIAFVIKSYLAGKDEGTIMDSCTGATDYITALLNKFNNGGKRKRKLRQPK